jgi:lipopolysaccharide export system permease protein
MLILDRYIGSVLVRQFVYALAALVAVFTVVNLTEELRLTDTPGYGVGQVIAFIIKTLPAEAHRLIPAAALLGAVLGLGQLQSQNEIVALQAAGVSMARLVLPVVVTAALLAALGVGFAETVAAPLSQQAHRQRALALAGFQPLGAGPGLWVRDGSRFVNIGVVHASGSLGDVYEFDFVNGELHRVTYAETAELRDGSWALEDVHESLLGEGDASGRQIATKAWHPGVDPRQLQSLWLRPEDLSIAELSRTIELLRRQRQNPLSYELAFWQAVTAPLYAVVMVLLAVPLVLVVGRGVRVGERIVIAALAGLGFQLLQQTFTNIGLASDFPPLVTAMTPAVFGLAAVAVLLRRGMVQ